MKMTNTVIKILFDALNQPGFTNEAVGLTGYAIYKNIRILSNDLKDYQKAVDAAIKKYGKKNFEGYYIDPNDSESIEKFTQEITPISNAKIDVNLFQISKNDFELPYCETATPNQYAIIEDFLVKHDKKNETIIQE